MTKLASVLFWVVLLFSLGCNNVAVDVESEPEPEPTIDWQFVKDAPSDTLIPMLNSPDPEIRNWVVAELGHNRREWSALPQIISAFERERDTLVFQTFAAVLLNNRSPAAMDAVVSAWLEERSPENQPLLLTGLYGADPCRVEAAMRRVGHLAPKKPMPVRQRCPEQSSD